MESHNLLREVFKETSPKQIAEDMGLSLSLIYKWSQAPGEDSSGTTNPLDRMASLIESTEDLRLIQWLCRKKKWFSLSQAQRRRK